MIGDERNEIIHGLGNSMKKIVENMSLKMTEITKVNEKSLKSYEAEI